MGLGALYESAMQAAFLERYTGSDGHTENFKQMAADKPLWRPIRQSKLWERQTIRSASRSITPAPYASSAFCLRMRSAATDTSLK